jgi:FAD/FMN-containing dehydrogenase
MNSPMNEETLKALREAVGNGSLVTDPAVLACYGDDLTEQDPCPPAAVATPTSMDGLRALVRAAHARSVPLVPRCGGTNVGGLCIPTPEGLVVDLTLLSEVELINEQDMVAVIQPGVTWMKLSRMLQELEPPLNFSYPLAPLHSCVMAGCILDGLGSISLKHGTTSEMIGGLEVLLPDGTTVQTGMAALFRDRPDWWVARAPLPDLTGLFVGWQGTTGIVTRMALQLWKLPPLRRRYFVLFEKLDGGLETVVRLAGRHGLCDDLAGITWPATRFLFRLYEPIPRDAAEAEFFAYVDIGGFSPEEMEWKQHEMGRIFEELKQGPGKVSAVRIDDLVRIAPSLGVFAKQPTTLSFLTSHSLGGMTWVGAYGPLSTFADAARSSLGVMEKHGIPPAMVSRPMKGGHFGVLRFLSIFDHADAPTRRRIRAMNEEIADTLLERGFAPYKSPPWAWSRLLERMDPATVKLMKTVRSALDPRGIMNPGKLAI